MAQIIFDNDNISNGTDTEDGRKKITYNNNKNIKDDNGNCLITMIMNLLVRIMITRITYIKVMCVFVFILIVLLMRNEIEKSCHR